MHNAVFVLHHDSWSNSVFPFYSPYCKRSFPLTITAPEVSYHRSMRHSPCLEADEMHIYQSGAVKCRIMLIRRLFVVGRAVRHPPHIHAQTNARAISRSAPSLPHRRLKLLSYYVLLPPVYLSTSLSGPLSEPITLAAPHCCCLHSI